MGQIKKTFKVKSPDILTRPPDAELNTNLPVSADESVSIVKGDAELRIDLPVSADEIIPVVTQNAELRTDISTAPDTERIVVPKTTQPINIDISTAPDTEKVSIPRQTQPINTQISQSSDELIQTVRQPAMLSSDIAASDDMPMQRFEMGFTGKWLPKGDPLVIGERNFSELENWRYTDFGIESIGGATLVNTTSISNTINTGIQLVTNYVNHNASGTYILVQAFNGASAKQIEINEGAVPAQVDFSSSTGQILVEDSSAVSARFSLLPNNCVGICDGEDDYIWGGEQVSIDAFLQGTVSANVWSINTSDKVIDLTDRVNNTLSNSANLAIIKGTQDALVYLAGFTRPVDGFYFDKQIANTTHATMNVSYYTTAAGWATVTIDDGTDNNGDSLGADGWVEFASKYVPDPYLINGLYLNFYRIYFTGALDDTTSLKTLTGFNKLVNARQPIDIWDGVFREPLLFKVHEATDLDYTLDVRTKSYGALTDHTSVFADLSGLLTTEYVTVVFDEPMAGFKIVMSNLVSDQTATAVVSIWDVTGGGGWNSGGILKDTTVDEATRAISLSQTGYMLFEEGVNEGQTTIDGITGWAYKITWGASLGASTKLDIFYGISRYRTLKPHKFPFQYKNRAMWCNSLKDKEYNRADYSKANAPDVFNGDDASGYNNERSLYFGDSKALTGAVELFNQYGQTVETVALFFKNTETYMLSGDTPSDFKIFTISQSIGCPAPETITSAEVSFKSPDAPAQNIALWLSDKGPAMFLGNTIRRIPGVENFFDTNVDSTSNLDVQNIAQASAWFDSTYQEWNLLFPIGTAGTQTTNNKWIVYDIVRDKWYEKKPDSSAMFPQGAFPVEDQYGNTYNYGYGVDGYLQRMESGLNWYDSNGAVTANVSQVITTSDFFFTKSIWDETRIRRFETIWAETNQTALDVGGTLNASYYYQASITTTAVTGLPSDQAMGYAGYRIRHLISYIDKIAWCHRFKLTITNAIGKLALLGLGIQWQHVREGLRDKEYFDSDP